MKQIITNQTFSITKRKEALHKIKTWLIHNQVEINKALKQDLNKSEQETYLSEIGPILMEVNLALKNLKKWTKPKKVRSNLTVFKSKSKIYQEPFGKVLIISPWNYPLQLSLVPLIGAIAAGNQVILKPSEIAFHTEKLLKKFIKNSFDSDHVDIVTGGVSVTTKLLQEKFDFIFFTGSTKVGQIVYKAATENLTPVILELGGKSPCIVNDYKDLTTVAERIAWGKLLNAGQTCIAPDYLLIKKGLEQEFIQAYHHAVIKFFGDNILTNPDYPKIINQKHHQHLLDLIKGSEVLLEAPINKEKIGALIVNGQLNTPLMNEEIFGPILPIITYKKLEEAIKIIQEKPKPLALYLFTENKVIEKQILNNLSYGGATVNDTIKHFINPNLSFGGIGSSGLGKYHGQATFQAFSHEKGVVISSTKVKVKLPFFPTKKQKIWLLKKLMR